MTRLILIATVALSAVAFAPRPAAAGTCTGDYVTCLNDTHDLTGALQTMADIECFSGYVGCIREQLFGM